MKTFKKIIIGASCWSAGRILQGDTECLVIDRHAAIGREYFDTYRECLPNDAPLNTPAARELRRELSERGKSGDTAALAPALYAKLHHLTGQFRLWTEITGIRREADCWRISIHDVEGDKVLHAESLIDCTPECITRPDFGRSNTVGIRLNAILLAPGCGKWESSSLRLRPGRREDEFVLSVQIPPGTGWATARALLLAEWRKRPESWRDARICTIAGEFEYEVRESSARLDDNYHYFNSARFSDPLAALDDAGDTIC
jgi:hypothetical protein